jgi:hypothetical protein
MGKMLNPSEAKRKADEAKAAGRPSYPNLKKGGKVRATMRWLRNTWRRNEHIRHSIIQS